MTRLAALMLVVPFAGCGGGGGGGSSIPEVPFSAFSAVRPNTTVVMSGGMSVTASGTYHTAGNAIVVDSVGPAVQDPASSTQKLTYDANMSLSAMAFVTPSGSASFSRGSGTFVCSTGVCQGISGASTGVVMDGTFAPLGWNYQTFGVWETANGSSFQAGAISAGIPTAGASLPVIGTANFTGVANGFYIDSLGATYFTSAAMSASVDWNAHSINFTTGTSISAPDTRLVNLSTGVQTVNSGLNLSGTLTYAPGVNAFTGTVTTQNLQLSGPANGRFYGPAATEIGGTYALTGAGVQRMSGGFGGRQ